jgi:RNA polymerase sigma-70 factor (ECF subfamily)
VSSTHFAIDVPDSLIERLRRSDARAFEQVYRLFERPVFSLARRMLDDADEAQDVLHEVMLTVIDKLDQFRGAAPFWGWLRQIAVNCVLMRMRKRRPLIYVEELPEPDTLAIDEARAFEGRDLERAFARLPETTRSVLWLYYVEGYSHEEIAASFGKSLSFSKSQVLRGAERLRGLLLEPAGMPSYA